jgi:hypothetical protein
MQGVNIPPSDFRGRLERVPKKHTGGDYAQVIDRPRGAVLSQFAGSAWAVTSDVLQGDFSDVDYGGNSSTAPATTFITNGATGSALQWGIGSVTYGTNYSTIEFIGATVPIEDTAEPVLIGAGHNEINPCR